MIDKNLAASVLEAALSSGGDFAELYIEDGFSNSVSMTNGSVEDAIHRRSCGAGVRIFSGTRSVYAYTTGYESEDLLRTAKAAAAAISGPGGQDVKVFVPSSHEVAPTIPFATVDNARRIEKLREAHLAAKSHSAEVAQVIASLADYDKDILVCNSEGVFATDRRARMRLAVQAVAANENVRQTGYCAPGYSMGFEGFDRIDPAETGITAARQAVTMLHADLCPAGNFPVVIDGGFGGVIFHEACGHSLEATSVSRGNSVFCNKIGEKIAADCVSAVDDGTMPGEWGSIHIDDEGTPSQRNLLIENGILKGYMIDRLGGRRMGMAPTGSSRRQDYTFAPTSRMTNTFICPGNDDVDEMIRTMGDGLYAASMGGGSVSPLTGEFNFAVNEAYWVKDGKIFCPVRGATLVGSGSQILLNIDRVGPKMWMAPGMCGSMSGQVPTNVGQPRIRVSTITVGGKGGAL